MATPDHTPAGRGYDSSLIYYHHANDYWTFHVGACNGSVVDLWNCYGTKCDAQLGVPGIGQPAHNKMNGAGCTNAHQHATNSSKPCVYEDVLFEGRMTSVIEAHQSGDKPLFLFWSTHIVHGPLQVPDASLENFSFIPDKSRATYHSMVNWIDGAIGRVTGAMRAKGLWNNTLMVLLADNGGPIAGGSNNFPVCCLSARFD
jgi:arylsulfatase I/J